MTLMQKFDLNSLKDDAVKTEYRTLLARADAIGRSLHRAYGSDRQSIDTQFFYDNSYNAEVGQGDGCYLIGISAAVPLLNLVFFGRLLSEPEVLPFLDVSKPLASDYVLPAIIDPSDFSLRSNWKVELTPIRAFAAGTLADLCSTFVVCHEMGHVACGHVEGMRAYEGRSTVSEFVKFGVMPKTVFDRRQAWEFDADVVACSLLIGFLEELWKDAETNQRTASVFGHGHDGLKNILSYAVVSLFSFFCYLKGTEDAINFRSTHPHPLVRAYYIKDALFRLSAAQWNVDLEAVERTLDDRMDEFMKVLQQLSMLKSRDYEPNNVRKIESNGRRMNRLQRTHRSSCAQWSWIDWE